MDAKKVGAKQNLKETADSGAQNKNMKVLKNEQKAKEAKAALARQIAGQ